MPLVSIQKETLDGKGHLSSVFMIIARTLIP